jgi:AmiR/NasT family two-component response regulator
VFRHLCHAAAPDPTSRKSIDVAVGVLVGLRGCSEREAFDELATVVRETGIGLGCTATALVALATGASTPDHAEAFTAWGALLGRRYGAATGLGLAD